jgi:hypothetical protein
MREQLRERLETEVTRKQFLQYMAGAILMVFGFSNLLSLLQGTKVIEKQIFLPAPGGDHGSGFGTRRFGV